MDLNRIKKNSMIEIERQKKKIEKIKKNYISPEAHMKEVFINSLQIFQY